MKNLEDLVLENQNVSINEELSSESLMLLPLMIYAASYTISSIIMASAMTRGGGYIEDYVSVTDKLLKDRKAKKILKKIAADERVKEFLALPENQQKGKWRKLLREILPEEEYETVYGVARYAIKDMIKKKK